MQAGADLLAERSIDAIPVNDIVERAGVAKGSFFNHFIDKDDFAAAIATDIRIQLDDRVTAANAGVTDAAARMARGICSFVQFALTDDKAARIMLRGHPRATQADHPMNAGVRADIARGAASGRFTVESEDAALIYVTGACQMLMGAVLGRKLSPSEAAGLTARTLTMILSGLGVSRDEASALAISAAAEIADSKAAQD